MQLAPSTAPTALKAQLALQAPSFLTELTAPQATQSTSTPTMGSFMSPTMGASGITLRCFSANSSGVSEENWLTPILQEEPKSPLWSLIFSRFLLQISRRQVSSSRVKERPNWVFQASNPVSWVLKEESSNSPVERIAARATSNLFINYTYWGGMPFYSYKCGQKIPWL